MTGSDPHAELPTAYRPARGPAGLLLGFLLLGLAACGDGSAAGGGGADDPLEIVVAAASDLRFAFEELGRDFEASTGVPVRFSFGSSGLLAAQIVNGAPFDVFASADVGFVDRVVAAGRGDAGTVATYAIGRIVLWQQGDGDPPAGVADLADPRYGRIAVANPDHAPYGRAAVEALRSAGIEEAVRDRLVYGDNIADTLRLATSGNVDVAVVALSLAIVTDGGRYTLVPEDEHERLEQALVVTAADDRRADAARRFVAYLGSPQGREVMVRYGFVLPGDPPFEEIGAVPQVAPED